MAHLSMSDDEMTTFIKDGFGVDSSYSAKDLFEAAELPSWLSVRTDLGLSSSAVRQGCAGSRIRRDRVGVATGAATAAAMVPRPAAASAAVRAAAARAEVSGAAAAAARAEVSRAAAARVGQEAACSPQKFPRAETGFDTRSSRRKRVRYSHGLKERRIKQVTRNFKEPFTTTTIKKGVQSLDLPTYPPRPPQRLVPDLPTYPLGLSPGWTYLV